MTDDTHWMGLALEDARAAARAGEVPVGAVLVRRGQLIARGRNAPIGAHDPSAHAEIAAMRSAGATLGNYRLEDCELFVTLEPCAMCAGALLHARVNRVVFGAHDPKTGAAGSVVDLFAVDRLNHRTQVQGGVRAAECAALLQEFFKERRVHARAEAEPLREDALRTPPGRFVGLDANALAPRYESRLAVLEGLRLHYLDAGPPDAALTCLCLHGPGEWGHYFRHLLPHAGAGMRMLVPDLIGFGRSDKPKRSGRHRVDWHLDVLEEWIQNVQAGPVALLHSEAARDWAQLLFNRSPTRFGCVLEAPDDGPRDVGEAEALRAAWRAPFPDRGHEAALVAFGRSQAGTSGPSAETATLLVRRVREAMGYSTE